MPLRCSSHLIKFYISAIIHMSKYNLACPRVGVGISEARPLVSSTAGGFMALPAVEILFRTSEASITGSLSV